MDMLDEDDELDIIYTILYLVDDELDDIGLIVVDVQRQVMVADEVGHEILIDDELDANEYSY